MNIDRAGLEMGTRRARQIIYLAGGKYNFDYRIAEKSFSNRQDKKN